MSQPANQSISKKVRRSEVILEIEGSTRNKRRRYAPWHKVLLHLQFSITFTKTVLNALIVSVLLFPVKRFPWPSTTKEFQVQEKIPVNIYKIFYFWNCKFDWYGIPTLNSIMYVLVFFFHNLWIMKRSLVLPLKIAFKKINFNFFEFFQTVWQSFRAYTRILGLFELRQLQLNSFCHSEA